MTRKLRMLIDILIHSRQPYYLEDVSLVTSHWSRYVPQYPAAEQHEPPSELLGSQV